MFVELTACRTIMPMKHDPQDIKVDLLKWNIYEFCLFPSALGVEGGNLRITTFLLYKKRILAC